MQFKQSTRDTFANKPRLLLLSDFFLVTLINGPSQNALYFAATNHRYWPADTQSFGNARMSYWYEENPSVIEIETAAYAVLAQIKNSDSTYADPVVNWLLTQGNQRGAFSSTQVCAMQCI